MVYIDKLAIMNVIGSIFKESSFLANEEYTFAENDFYDRIPKIIYSAMNNLYCDGIKKFDFIIIDEYLSKTKVYEEFKQTGIDYLKKCIDITTLDNFDFYYERMKKFTVLRTMDSFGINMKWFYDPSISPLSVTKVQEQEERLNSTSRAEMGILIDKHIDEIKLKCSDMENKVGDQVGEGMMSLLEALKVSPAVGVPLYGKYINTITKGARLSKFYLRSAATGIGKAIPNYTMIPTPKGIRRVDEIQIGDYLFDRKGMPTKVTGVYPQETPKEVYEVHLNDGRIAECCKDHLWTYKFKSADGKWTGIRTRTTKELYDQAAGRYRINGYVRFAIPLCDALEYKEKKTYKMDPYTLGALLGGCYLPIKGDKYGLDCEERLDLKRKIDPLTIEEILNLEGWGYAEKAHSKYAKDKFAINPHWIIYNDDGKTVKKKDIFKLVPELEMTSSEHRFIPRKYLEGSIEQRWSLLQGLMDASGFFDTCSHELKFRAYDSIQLKEDFKELCYGLGLMCTAYDVDTYDGSRNTVKLKLMAGTKEDVFRTDTYYQEFTRVRQNYNSVFREYIAIDNIVPTGRFVDMTCFTVDNPEHLFVMNDGIVTHNTRTMIADACNIACEEVFDVDKMQWIKNGAHEPTLYISTEQEIDEAQTMLMSFVSDVEEEKILDGVLTFDEEARVKRAIEILTKSPLYIVTCPDFSLQDIENIIKINIKQRGIRYVFFDYIHTSMKILEEITRRSGGVKLREDNILFMLSVTLKDICNKYDIFIESSTQLNGSWLDATEVNQNLLRGAKSISDKIDVGSIIMPLREFEKDAIKIASQKMNCEKVPTIGIWFYKNRRSKYKDVVVWCYNYLGRCKLKPAFVTDANYQLIDVPELNIEVKNNDRVF